jgi:hypothetical protein
MKIKGPKATLAGLGVAGGVLTLLIVPIAFLGATFPKEHHPTKNYP